MSLNVNPLEKATISNSKFVARENLQKSVKMRTLKIPARPQTIVLRIKITLNAVLANVLMRKKFVLALSLLLIQSVITNALKEKNVALLILHANPKKTVTSAQWFSVQQMLLIAATLSAKSTHVMQNAKTIMTAMKVNNAVKESARMETANNVNLTMTALRVKNAVESIIDARNLKIVTCAHWLSVAEIILTVATHNVKIDLVALNVWLMTIANMEINAAIQSA